MDGIYFFIYKNKEYEALGVELINDREYMKVVSDGKCEYILLDYFQIKFKRSR